MAFFRPVALKFRRNIVVADGTPWGKSTFVYISPVLTRGLTAELPKPAGIGIVFKVGPDGGLIVKSMAEDGPAKLSRKINLEDCLMGVDGRKVFGQSITQVRLEYRSLKTTALVCNLCLYAVSLPALQSHAAPR